MKPIRIKHPFSGVSHFVGAILALAGLFLLIYEAHGRPWHITSFAIYGATLFLLYISSALFHTLSVPPHVEDALYGLDRAAIYLLIAGTYTPVCLVALQGGWGWSIFGVVWGLAIVGIVVDIVLRQRTPDWLQAGLYLLMGWVALVAIVPLVHVLPLPALGWLLLGCVIYTVGAVICVKRPGPIPGIRFSAHDLWHCMVLAASACHFILMLFFIARL